MTTLISTSHKRQYEDCVYDQSDSFINTKKIKKAITTNSEWKKPKRNGDCCNYDEMIIKKFKALHCQPETGTSLLSATTPSSMMKTRIFFQALVESQLQKNTVLNSELVQALIRMNDLAISQAFEAGRDHGVYMNTVCEHQNGEQKEEEDMYLLNQIYDQGIPQPQYYNVSQTLSWQHHSSFTQLPSRTHEVDYIS